MAITKLQPFNLDTTANYTFANVTASNVNGANLVSANYVTGTLTTATQPNITSTGTLVNLTVSGNTAFSGANVSLGAVGNLKITGGTANYVLQTDGAGNLIWVAQSGGGNAGNISNGNSNVSIATANGNITMSSAGNANIVIVTGTGVNLAGTLNVTGNATVGNIVTSGSGGNISNVNVISANTFIASGNISANNINTTGSGGNIGNANVISANTFTASGNITASNANLGNSVTANYFTGNFYGTANSATSATTAGTVTTAAQPNITSVGTLTGLTSTGTVNLIGASNVSLGPVGNVKITGGSNGQYLSTDGSGTLSWANVSSGSTSNISNGNSNVNIPSANGNINLTAVGNTVMVITGTGVNVAGTLNVTGNATVGNIVTSGSGGNVSNVNVISANTFIASGNITAGNINTTGSGGNIGNANVISANTFVASGNITSANANLGNLVTANYFTGNGSLLTGITVSAGNTIVNGNSNVLVSANGNITMSSAGNANIVVVTGTGVNIAGTLNATGNASLGNLVTSGSGGNITNANVISANTFTASGNVTGAYILGNGSQLTGISTSSSSISNGNSNVNIAAANGNITMSAVGNANIVIVTGTGVNIAGTLNATGNASLGNLVTSGSGGNITNANVISANTFTASGNITAGNANLGNLVTANFFTGNGSLLTGITVSAGNTIVNGNSNVLIAANGNITMSSAGNANIVIVTGTGVNVAGTLNVSGNATVGNLTTSGSGGNLSNINVISANTFIASGNISANNINTTGSGGNIGNANVISANTFVATGNITAGNASLGNSVTANYFTGNGSTLSALTFGNITTFSTAGLTTDELYLQATTRLNVTASGASGYLFDQYGATLNPAIYVTSGQTLAFNLNVSGHPFLIQTSGGANYSTGLEHVNTTGTVSTTTAAQGQIAGTLYWKIPYGITGNYKYQCSIHGGMNGNIVVTDANVANITVGLATFATTANAVAGANISGQVSNALVSGTVYTNAQPNITSIGSLTGLTVSNATGIVDFTTTANVTLGAVANLHISGGTNAYVLSTDGAGNLSWVAQSGGGGGANISNGNSNVNIPVAGGNINFSAVGNANVMTITGTGANFSGYANITGNIALSGANVTLGTVANLHITGGSNTFVLSTDGSGNLSWAAASGTSIGVDNFTGNGVQTAYTLTSTPANANATLVSIAGTFQPRTVYSLTGNVITFSSAPPNTSPIEVTTFTSGGGGGITAQDLLSPFLLMGA